MSKAILTQEELKNLLFYNPDTGVFIKTGSPYRKANGRVLGSNKGKGYLGTMLKGVSYRLHRLAWLYMTGEYPEGQIDHINRDRSDNRWGNLRLVSNIENQRNQSIPKNNTSGIMGVCFEARSGLWKARINNGNEREYLGSFKDFFEACCARKSAEIRIGYHPLHGRNP